MQLSIRRRFQLAYVALAALLVPAAYLTVRTLQYRRPQPLAPQAVALVRRYLEILRAGDRAGACRIVELPSLCASSAPFEVQRFTVAPAQPTVNGVEVPATIDDEDALFVLSAGHRGVYRIVDVVADAARTPALPTLG
jgi:hypothetical protein